MKERRGTYGLVDAMRKRGVEVEYIVQDNEGQGIRNDENKFGFHAAMGRFLDRHLHPQE